MTDPLQTFWDNLLSRQRERILDTFNSLNEDDRQAVLIHLQRMVDEPDWHPEQRVSALAALDALDPDKSVDYGP